MDAPAVVARFLDLLTGPTTGACRLDGNWGTGAAPGAWNVDADTYIAGIVLTVDFDYRMGYLLEVVDRAARTVAWLAVVTHHGRPCDGRTWRHDWAAHPAGPQPISDRAVGGPDVAHWAVGFIYDQVRVAETAPA